MSQDLPITELTGSGRMLVNQRYLPLLHSAGLDQYERIMTSSQGQPLVKSGLGGRQRVRLTLEGADGTERTIYLKRYARIGPARREWRGLLETRRCGISAPDPIAMGQGPVGGFVILSAVGGEALERCMGELLQRFGQDAGTMADLTEKLGVLAGTLHAAGLAHRDFYASHVFLEETRPDQPPAASRSAGRFKLHLIDLARVFRPRWRRWRWRAKDLAQLKFSLPPAWVQAHWPAVVEAYQRRLGRPLPRTAEWTIDRRVKRMRRRAAH